MKNVDEIVIMMRTLPRVQPGRPGGRPSDAGARTLLASIMEEEPGAAAVEPQRRYGFRRLALSLAAAALLATGIVVGPSLLQDGGGAASSYASSEIEIQREGDEYVARIKDPYADHDKYSKAFKAVGLDVDLLIVPVSPSRVGMVVSGSVGASGPGNVTTWTSAMVDRDERECKAGEKGCYLLLRLPADLTGKSWFKLGRQARAGETYDDPGRATVAGEDLAGAKVHGRPVGQVMAEVRKRGLTAGFELVKPFGPDKGYGLDPLTADQVGDDWTVWDAESVRAGVVRLLVTREHLNYNPIYGMDVQPES
ncbi:hypothetical protein GCM10023194_80650 [Planotetraspora phitsanulokensis]|uniref:Uncharacterized protein n=1 Tax=Planotetraspora phitsanulokensis TaxID=575192 RepID=A0A8J3UBN4_9ACTN|nr:hypothetical protein [Planotetraspora phitsanulokensis]GII41606.1 hypothetical protein Pph01_66090 [Planotetraspora phitsanulokensis]